MNLKKYTVASWIVALFLLNNSFLFAQLQKGYTPIGFESFRPKDIGKNTKPGKMNIFGDTLIITASGSDIWGNNDECFFAIRGGFGGDFDLSVQVLSLDKSHLYAKAGIMARNSLSDSSKHVYFQVFPDNSPRNNNNNGGCEFQYRSENGKEMKAIYPNKKTAGKKFDVDFPNTWIRLKRKGDVFKSYFSNDGKKWNLYSSFTLKMQKGLFVGLAVTSHDANNFTTAKFKSFMLKK